MFSSHRLQSTISWLLLIGMLVSACLVFFGSTLFLFKHGQVTIQSGLLQFEPQQSSILSVWQFAFSLTPQGIIQLGLLSLVATQLLRVALLCYFYIITRDLWFTLINAGILLLLIYSTFWRT